MFNSGAASNSQCKSSAYITRSTSYYVCLSILCESTLCPPLCQSRPWKLNSLLPRYTKTHLPYLTQTFVAHPRPCDPLLPLLPFPTLPSLPSPLPLSLLPFLSLLAGLLTLSTLTPSPSLPPLTSCLRLPSPSNPTHTTHPSAL